MCFNSAKSWQTGWYTEKSRIVQTGDCFEENLYGIADYNNTASSFVLVKIDDTSANDIFITYNRKIGINNGTVEAGNRVTVTRAGGEGTKYAESELLAKLNNGGTWSGIVSGKNMTVKVLSIETTFEFARVRISENGIPCPVVNVPTEKPSSRASPTSSGSPSSAPSESASPTAKGEPTLRPTQMPTTRQPTTRRPFTPTRNPVTRAPTRIPTQKLTSSPSASPSSGPTSSPSTNPTAVQTSLPTQKPTSSPSASPSSGPTSSPSTNPTAVLTSLPTGIPTQKKSPSPTSEPSPVFRMVPLSRKPTSVMPTTLKPKALPSSSSIKGSKAHKTHKDKIRQPPKDKKDGKLY